MCLSTILLVRGVFDERLRCRSSASLFEAGDVHYRIFSSMGRRLWVLCFFTDTLNAVDEYTKAEPN